MSAYYYLKVPFYKKEEVKKLGASWDLEKKSWYYTIENKENLDKWLEENKGEKEKRHYIAVPFAEKETAKEFGAQWDKDRKLWYFTGKNNDEKYSRWLQNNDLKKKVEKSNDYEFEI